MLHDSYVACELLRQANYRDNCTFRSLVHVTGMTKDSKQKRVINLQRPKPLPANDSLEYCANDRFRCRSRLATSQYPEIKQTLSQYWLVDAAPGATLKPYKIPEVRSLARATLRSHALSRTHAQRHVCAADGNAGDRLPIPAVAGDGRGAAECHRLRDLAGSTAALPQ